MSGGAFNGLASRSAAELLAGVGDLSEMAYTLDRIVDGVDAARETYALVRIAYETRRKIEDHQARLNPVFAAVEAWQSGDVGEDTVRAALARYRGAACPPPPTPDGGATT